MSVKNNNFCKNRTFLRKPNFKVLDWFFTVTQRDKLTIQADMGSVTCDAELLSREVDITLPIPLSRIVFQPPASHFPSLNSYSYPTPKRTARAISHTNITTCHIAILLPIIFK